MKTLAIIAEYNPLHDGHRYHFAESLAQSQSSHSLILMSGNFVQRGEPAITDKYNRAAQAIAMGADLVLELPFIYAVNSADYFAAGAIRILEASGVVDVVSFGSETADRDQLQATADRLLEANHFGEINHYLRQGYSYAQAVDKRLGHVIRKPNDILAVQYLKALKQQASSIEPLIIKRQGDYHDDSLAPRYPSASAIRQAHRDGRMATIAQPIYLEHLTQAIFTKLILDDLESIHGMSEGIDFALKRQVLNCTTIAQLLDECRTPRFSLARLRRLLIHSLLGYQRVHQQSLQKTVYFRPLAFNQKGRELLRLIKANQPERFIPTLARYTGPDDVQQALDFDIRSSNLYYQLQQTRPEQSRKAIYSPTSTT